MAEEEDDDHHGRRRERSGQTPTGNLQKLLAAGAITVGGLLANQALSEPEKPPEITRGPARLIPNHPMPEEKPDPDTWALRVQVPQPGLERSLVITRCPALESAARNNAR